MCLSFLPRSLACRSCVFVSPFPGIVGVHPSTLHPPSSSVRCPLSPKCEDQVITQLVGTTNHGILIRAHSSLLQTVSDWDMPCNKSLSIWIVAVGLDLSNLSTNTRTCSLFSSHSVSADSTAAEGEETLINLDQPFFSSSCLTPGRHAPACFPCTLACTSLSLSVPASAAPSWRLSEPSAKHVVFSVFAHQGLLG